MADILITANMDADVAYQASPNAGPRWIDELIGYWAFITTAEDLVLWKTADGGATWAIVGTIDSAASVMLSFALWPDKWTTDDTGTLIHIVWQSETTPGTTRDGLWYRAFDTATEVFTAAAVRLVNFPSQTNAKGRTHRTIGVTKSRGGYLDAGVTSARTAAGGGTDLYFFRSVDAGLTWVQRADFIEATDNAPNDFWLMLPGNEADDQDIWVAYFDVSAGEVSLKVYDDSANTWAETSIDAVGNVWNGMEVMTIGQAAIRHSDDHMLLAFWSHQNNAAADLKTYDINGAGSIVAKTNAETNFLNVGLAMTLNQNTGDWYLIYGDSSGGLANIDIFYRKSGDGGGSWDAAVQLNVTARQFFDQSADWSVGADGGRLLAVFYDDANDDAYTNFDLAFDLAAVPPPPPPTPVPPPVIYPPGGSFTRALSGGAGGFMTYITPDGRLYPFHTPHEIGRWVVSFSGFGTPPIEYITERGPFQHGATVRDYFLRPRVIQLLIRQAFCDRVDWWGGRATLLNEIRPNRQGTPTAVEPGELRVMETDGTLRSLNVFIQDGPRFEPRESTEWDEWAFQEVLRFIAYDPVAFDPSQVTASFAVAVAAQLVFPITFPIQFGSGVLDETLNVTYPGTWQSFPIITIVGPIGLPRLDNNTTGEKLEFGTNIAPGRTITIDLTEGNKTVVDDLGNNLIGTLTSDSDLGTFHLAPDPEAPLGVNVLRLRGNNPTGATAVSLAYFERYFGF